MNRDAPGSAGGTNDFSVYWRIILSLVITLVLVQPAVQLLQYPVTASGWFQLVAALIFGVLVLWKVWVTAPGAQPTPWIVLAFAAVVRFPAPRGGPAEPAGMRMGG